MSDETLSPTIRAVVYMIQAVGFPVVVAGWVLWRLNGRLERLARELIALRETILHLRGHVIPYDDGR